MIPEQDLKRYEEKLNMLSTIPFEAWVQMGLELGMAASALLADIREYQRLLKWALTWLDLEYDPAQPNIEPEWLDTYNTAKEAVKCIKQEIL